MNEAPIVQLVAKDLERGLELLSQYPAFGTEAATLWDELRRALYATWVKVTKAQEYGVKASDYFV